MAEVVYQIFVDRFAGDELRAIDESGEHWMEHAGGTLDGIARRLSHVASVGADAIYLTPVVRAPSNHKYDTADFEAVDARFGGDAAFARLVEAARGKKMGVILDGVFNHVGEEHAWAREKKFLRGSVWRGFPSLPELDLRDPGLRNELFGEGGVMARWTRRGATGWRLDCANDLGHEVCALATRAAKTAGATDGVIGEIMAYPVGWTPALDGVMNYWLRSCALAAATGGPAAQVQHALDGLAREMDPQSSWNLVSSHDTPRLSTILDGNEARARLALALAFFYPGVPMIYYGEEIGMSGGKDPANRRAMEWDESRWNRSRWETVRHFAALRKKEPALRQGNYVALQQAGTDLVAFARTTRIPSEKLIFVANCAAERRAARLFAPLASLYDAVPLEDLIGDVEARVHAGCLELTLPPHGVTLLKPRDDHPSGYRFWK